MVGRAGSAGCRLRWLTFAPRKTEPPVCEGGEGDGDRWKGLLVVSVVIAGLGFGVGPCVCSEMQSCESKGERDERRRRQRLELHKRAEARTGALATARGGGAHVECKETDTNLGKTWGEYECTALLTDGRWLRAVCDVGELTGCRVDWIGHEGGPQPKKARTDGNAEE
jgi:hypothetical protein